MMILMNVPLWVWPLLVALIGVGVLQMRTRQVSRTRLLVVPFVLLVVSAFSIHGSFQGHVMALMAWLCGVLLALGLNLLIVKSPGEARYHHEEQVFFGAGQYHAAHLDPDHLLHPLRRGDDEGDGASFGHFLYL